MTSSASRIENGQLTLSDLQTVRFQESKGFGRGYDEAEVDAFIARFPEFSIVPWPELWEQAAFSAAPPQSADGSIETLQMTPRSFGTDGFYVAVLQRR